MIKFEVNKGVVGSVGISGTVNDLLADTVFMIGYLHSKIKDQSKACGDVFEELLKQFFKDEKMADMIFQFPSESDDSGFGDGVVGVNINEQGLKDQLAELMSNKNKRENEDK